MSGHKSNSATLDHTRPSFRVSYPPQPTLSHAFPRFLMGDVGDRRGAPFLWPPVLADHLPRFDRGDRGDGLHPLALS